MYGDDDPDHQMITQNLREANLCIDHWKQQDMKLVHIKECMSEVETTRYLQDTTECMNDIFIKFYIPSKVVNHIISFRNICNHCNTIIRIGYQSTYYCNYCDRKICENCFRVSNINYIQCAQCGLTGCYVCAETKFTQLSGWKYYHCLTCLNDNDNSNENNDY